MSQTATARFDVPVAPARVIVVPRLLAEHFHDRLAGLYQGRHDVRVIVDRRVAERRRDAGRPPASGNDRRSGDRRSTTPSWSLPEMPVRSAGDPAAAGGRH